MNIKFIVWFLLLFVLCGAVFAVEPAVGEEDDLVPEWTAESATFETAADITKFFELAEPPWEIVAEKESFWKQLPADKINDAPPSSLGEHWESLPDKSAISATQLKEVVSLKTDETSLDEISPTTVGELLNTIRGTTDNNAITFTNEKGIALKITADGTVSSETNSIKLSSYSGSFQVEVGEDKVIRIVTPDEVTSKTPNEIEESHEAENPNQLTVDLTQYTAEELTAQSFTLEVSTNSITPTKVVIDEGKTLYVFPGSSLKFEDSVWQITKDATSILSTTPNPYEGYFFKTAEIPITINGEGANNVLFDRGPIETVTITGSNFEMAYFDKNDAKDDQDIIFGEGEASVTVDDRRLVTVNSFTNDIRVSDYYVRTDGRTVISASSEKRVLPSVLRVNKNTESNSQRKFEQNYNFNARTSQWSGKITSTPFTYLNIEMNDETSPLGIALKILEYATQKTDDSNDEPTLEQLSRLTKYLVGVDLTGIALQDITKEILLEHPELVVAANRYPPGEGTGPQIIPTVVTYEDGSKIEGLPKFVLAHTNDAGSTSQLFVQAKNDGSEPGKAQIRAAFISILGDSNSPNELDSTYKIPQSKDPDAYLQQNIAFEQKLISELNKKGGNQLSLRAVSAAKRAEISENLDLDDTHSNGEKGIYPFPDKKSRANFGIGDLDESQLSNPEYAEKMYTKYLYGLVNSDQYSEIFADERVAKNPAAQATVLAAAVNGAYYWGNSDVTASVGATRITDEQITSKLLGEGTLYERYPEGLLNRLEEVYTKNKYRITVAEGVNGRQKNMNLIKSYNSVTTTPTQHSTTQINEIAQTYGFSNFEGLSDDLRNPNSNQPTYTFPNSKKDYSNPFTIHNQLDETLTIKDYNNDGKIDQQDLINAAYMAANGDLKESDDRYAKATNLLNRFGYSMNTLTSNRDGKIQPASQNPARTSTPPAATGGLKVATTESGEPAIKITRKGKDYFIPTKGLSTEAKRVLTKIANEPESYKSSGTCTSHADKTHADCGIKSDDNRLFEHKYYAPGSIHVNASIKDYNVFKNNLPPASKVAFARSDETRSKAAARNENNIVYNKGRGTHEVIILGALGNDKFLVQENTGSNRVQLDIETIKPEYVLRIRTAEDANEAAKKYK